MPISLMQQLWGISTLSVFIFLYPLQHWFNKATALAHWLQLYMLYGCFSTCWREQCNCLELHSCKSQTKQIWEIWFTIGCMEASVGGRYYRYISWKASPCLFWPLLISAPIIMSSRWRIYWRTKKGRHYWSHNCARSWFYLGWQEIIFLLRIEI